MFWTTSTIVSVALLAVGGLLLLACAPGRWREQGGLILLILAIGTAAIVVPPIVSTPGGRGPMPQINYDYDGEVLP